MREASLCVVGPEHQARHFCVCSMLGAHNGSDTWGIHIPTSWPEQTMLAAEMKACDLDTLTISDTSM
jgi:hypothetical protein